MIAYRQPARSEVEQIRGVDSSAVSKTISWDLVKVKGKREDEPETDIIGTTKTSSVYLIYEIIRPTNT